MRIMNQIFELSTVGYAVNTLLIGHVQYDCDGLAISQFLMAVDKKIIEIL